ncbi:MAG: LysR family transcriptional regulator [Alphaproteobacteria bacterium]
MIELSDLHVFRTVVQAGGVNRAAERLYRVQSNVTARVKKLEADLGVPLFLRDGRRLQLSPAGRVLLDYADRLLALAAEAEQAIHDGPRGPLRLGAMESTAAIRLPGPLSEYHRRHPDVAIELHTGDPRGLTARVVAGDLDAALVAEPVSDPRLEATPAFVERLVIVAGAGHAPIAAPADVTTRTVLVFHPGCPHRQRLEDWFARGGVAPDRVIEMNSYHAILGCAVVGMGVALMPESVLDGYRERGRLSVHPMTGDFRSVRTMLIWRRAAAQPKVTALLEVIGSPQASLPPDA